MRRCFVWRNIKELDKRIEVIDGYGDERELI